LPSVLAGTTFALRDSSPPGPAPEAAAQAGRDEDPQVLARPAESLQAKNLRLLRVEVAPKVCAALTSLSAPGRAVTVLETDAYDSRVRCVVEACLRPKVPGAGEASRVAFFFDTG